YSHTRLLLTGATGTIKLILSQRRSAEEVVAFLDGIIRLRQTGEKTLDRNPELLGFLAQQMSKGSSTAVAVPAGRLATQTIPHPPPALAAVAQRRPAPLPPRADHCRRHRRVLLLPIAQRRPPLRQRPLRRGAGGRLRAVAPLRAGVRRPPPS